jgi:hypothetical protein
MADEEGEIRRMAEIAEAINAILDADEQGADGPQAAFADTQAADAALPDALAYSGDQPDLDAAIAADVSQESDAGPSLTLNPSPGPSPNPEPNDKPSLKPRNNAIGQTVRADSQMADLSLRMQATLAEIRAQSSEAWLNSEDLLRDMEAARADMVSEIRAQMQAIADATQHRRDVIMAELTELENQAITARDQMELMLVKFEASLSALQSRYFQTAEAEKDRLSRYRDFLQFLLDERGL